VRVNRENVLLAQWVTYEKDFIGLEHQNSLEQLFLLLLLLSILAVLRKAFLRHVLRDRLRAQYEQLSLRIFKAKSVVYRLTMAGYGLPAPTVDSLPKTCKRLFTPKIDILPRTEVLWLRSATD
jgi:hypothetical protein